MNKNTFRSGTTGVGTISTAFRYEYTYTVNTEEVVDIGSEFYAYINIVGNQYNYGKVISLDPGNIVGNDGAIGGTNKIKAATPNYTDTKQIWKFTRVKSDGGSTICYYIQNVYDGMYLNTYQKVAGSLNNHLCTHSNDQNNNYKWRLVKKPSKNKLEDKVDVYSIRPQSLKEKEMHVYGMADTDVISADKDDTNGMPNAQFFIKKINTVKTNTLASIRNKYDIVKGLKNTCVGVDNANVSYQSYGDITNPNKTASLTWRFERANADNEYPPIYYVKHEETGKYLQVDMNDVETDNISVGDKTDGTNQQWILLGDTLDELNFISVYYSNRKYAYRIEEYNYDSNNEANYRNTDIVLAMDTPNADTNIGRTIQCGLNNFHDAQRFQVTYERYAVDKGDFYTTIKSSVDQTRAVSLKKYGTDVVFRRISGSPAADQQWCFKALGNYEYAIQNIANGSYLYLNTGVESSDKIDSEVLASDTFNNNSDYYRWYVVAEPNGNYSISCNFETKKGTYATSENGIFTDTGAKVKKVKGRGNGSWADSYVYTGKYSYNITLKDEAQLFSKLNTGTKYCLLANNADEAFVRNTTAFTLAKKLGLSYTPTFQYVDVYDNGDYMGSYLVTDKVEINSQSLALSYDFDDLNKTANPDIESATRKSTSGNINDNSTKGYKKWVYTENEPTNSDGTAIDIANGEGSYLLEIEFADRFPDEISGFISTKGQPVVVKAPEYATEKQVEYISNLFNQAEAAIYNPDSTLAEIEQYIDVDSFIKAYLIQELTKNIDACNSSFYIYYDYCSVTGTGNKKLHAGPVWDYDNTLGQFKQDGRKIVEGRSISPAEILSKYENADAWMANIKGMSTNKMTELDFEATLMSHGDVWDRMKEIWNGYTDSSSNTVKGFYSIVSEYFDSNNTGEGTLSYYLNEVEKCGAMNESRWGFIENDPLYANRQNTGSTFEQTSTYLRSWINARLKWLNGDTTIPGLTNPLTNLNPLGVATTDPSGRYVPTTDFSNWTAYINNVASGRDVVVNDGGSYAGRNVVVDTSNTNANHRWKFEKYTDEDGRMNVCVAADNGSDSQKWYVRSYSYNSEDYTYDLRHKSTNAVLDVYGASTSMGDGSNVATRKYDGSGAQKFIIKPNN